MTCPICGAATHETFRPFCSHGCKAIDLNRWLSDVYAIPATADSEEDESSITSTDAQTE